MGETLGEKQMDNLRYDALREVAEDMDREIADLETRLMEKRRVRLGLAFILGEVRDWPIEKSRKYYGLPDF